MIPAGHIRLQAVMPKNRYCMPKPALKNTERMFAYIRDKTGCGVKAAPHPEGGQNCGREKPVRSILLP